MTTVLGPGTPYITPDALQRQPLGIGWSSLVSRGSTPTALADVLIDICQQATSLVDGCCNQPLRATLNTEDLTGPGANRVGVDMSTGVATCVLRRGPVLAVTDVQLSSARTFPRRWTPIPAGQYEPATPVIGMYGTSSPADSGEGSQAILVAPGWISWNHGRNGYRVKVSYTNGWPHTSLTGDADGGATTLEVDDCTGWAPVSQGEPGAVGVVFDGNFQESVTVTESSAVSGPGTLTLESPLAKPHNAGVMVTTMPASIRWATALFAASQALTRGATTTTVQTTGGSGSATGSKAPESLATEARKILNTFARRW